MTCPQAELGSSSQNKAQARRRDPLPAAPARSELPDLIRRPALVPGRQGTSPMTTTRGLCGVPRNIWGCGSLYKIGAGPSELLGAAR